MDREEVEKPTRQEIIDVGVEMSYRLQASEAENRILREALQAIAWSSPWTAPSLDEAKMSQRIAREILESYKSHD